MKSVTFGRSLSLEACQKIRLLAFVVVVVVFFPSDLDYFLNLASQRDYFKASESVCVCGRERDVYANTHVCNLGGVESKE